jgi:hypothetical protein
LALAFDNGKFWRSRGLSSMIAVRDLPDEFFARTKEPKSFRALIALRVWLRSLNCKQAGLTSAFDPLRTLVF